MVCTMFLVHTCHINLPSAVVSADAHLIKLIMTFCFSCMPEIYSNTDIAVPDCFSN